MKIYLQSVKINQTFLKFFKVNQMNKDLENLGNRFNIQLKGKKNLIIIQPHR